MRAAEPPLPLFCTRFCHGERAAPPIFLIQFPNGLFRPPADRRRQECSRKSHDDTSSDHAVAVVVEDSGLAGGSGAHRRVEEQPDAAVFPHHDKSG